jgi:thiol-disulfide isomerase/thioredoxin
MPGALKRPISAPEDPSTLTTALTRRRALGGLATLWPACAAAVDEGPRPRPWPPRQPTLALDLPVHDGGRWRLADARGQVVIVNFWASWCEPCRAEMPSLELLEQRHEKDRLQVIAVNFRETDAAVRRFLDSSALSLRVLRDVDGAAARAFGVRVFPSTIAIGRDGRARFVVTGECDWTGAAARSWIAPLL